jgi:hypothetical protein
VAKRGSAYPPEAYAPNGVLWWRLTKHPDKNVRYGGERRIAAWLAFNVHEGDTFTMRDIREAVGPAPHKRDEAEHLNRRLRQLRFDGWRWSRTRAARRCPSMATG